MKKLNKKRITGIFIPFDNGVAQEKGIVTFTKKSTDEDGEEEIKHVKKPWASSELLKFAGAKIKVVESDVDVETKRKAAAFDRMKARKKAKESSNT